jgi:hypothetical protein
MQFVGIRIVNQVGIHNRNLSEFLTNFNLGRDFGFKKSHNHALL